MAEQTGGKTGNAVEKAREQRLAHMKKPEPRAKQTLAQTKSQREQKRKKSPVPPLVGNQYFRVYLGSTLVSFARVSNIQRTVEHEDLAEGGLNSYVHVLTKPGGASGNLTLEKGIVADDSVSDLMRALAPGTRISVPVTITLYNREADDWKPVRSWGFEDGMVSRWEIGNLDGLGSEVVIEKLEISHAGLAELEV